MLLTTLLSALIPGLIEIGKSTVAHFLGGVKPLTVDDQIKLDRSDIERLKALALLDQPGGTPSQWVIDLRASARYIGALSVILIGISTLFIPDISEVLAAIALEAANIAFGFLFGGRITAMVMKK